MKNIKNNKIAPIIIKVNIATKPPINKIKTIPCDKVAKISVVWFPFSFCVLLGLWNGRPLPFMLCTLNSWTYIA